MPAPAPPGAGTVAAKLRRAVGKVLALPDDALRFRPLPTRGAERCYRVEAVGGAGPWIVRAGSARAVPALLDVETEAGVMRRAAAAGLAPAVAGHDAEAGMLVTVCLASGRPWTPSAARRPDNIRRIAHHVASLHRLDVALPPFEPRTLAERYVAQAGGDGASRAQAEELRCLAEDFERRFEATALCHNDLVAENIVDDGRLWLIDFEYATLAHPVLDLAGLAAMNRYGAAQQAALLDAYYSGPAPFGDGEFPAVVRMLELLARFWSLACGADSDEARRYAGFGRRDPES